MAIGGGGGSGGSSGSTTGPLRQTRFGRRTFKTPTWAHRRSMPNLIHRRIKIRRIGKHG